MKGCSSRLGPARRFLAFVVAGSLGFSVFASFSATAKSLQKSDAGSTAVAGGTQLTVVSATATAAGVVIVWRTNNVSDNVGFNIYRIINGQRTRINPEIIPGSLFAPSAPKIPRSGYSYSWFDRNGSASATYVVEAVDVNGATLSAPAFAPVFSKALSGFEETANVADVTTAVTNPFQKYFPAAEAYQPNATNGAIEQQWAIAGQSALKIAIKRDGWYRVTQPQMAAAGFSPNVDIRNLRLFVDGNEVAILTSQITGQFSANDYIEFYGRGLDTPTTDTHIYYLIADTTPGKRVGGEILPTDDPSPTPTPVPTVAPTPLPTSIPEPPVPVVVPKLRDPIFFSWAGVQIQSISDSLRASNQQVAGSANKNTSSTPDPGFEFIVRAGHKSSTAKADEAPVDQTSITSAEKPPLNSTLPNDSPAGSPVVRLQPPAKASVVPGAVAKPSGVKTKRRLKKKRKSHASRINRVERAHVMLDNFTPVNFDYTVQIKDRLVYLSNLLNGDEENFFGKVISSTPVTQTLTVSNADQTATSATLEFALQGVTSQSGATHQVDVTLNGVMLGSVSFAPLEHPVRTFSVPLANLSNGNNTLTFTKTSTGEVCLVDYIRLTYPHSFKADAGSLKFNLRGSQTLDADGFSTPVVKLIDYTDPLNVIVTKPAAQATNAGYSITVPYGPDRSKTSRLLYAIPQGQFDSPASLSLNQPSTWNLSSNSGAFLVITHKNFIANLSPLLTQRQSQGLSTALVDIEDVYDEFSFGKHGPQAIKDFLSYAATHWATPPRYIIFAGDASLDPRNYFNVGDFDFVPTKLIDATYNETASDDWLADFDNDGIADIPIGRLPLRSTADTNLMVSKIITFVPGNVSPEAALLIADDPGTPAIWDFETANDDVQALLPASMTVQRVNVRTEPSPSQATTDIVNGLAQGRSVVNYSGHGNVDVWSGAGIFTSSNATALTNGNKLPFVIVMDCLNGYYHDPTLLSLAEAFVKAPNGGAIAAFASSGLTTTFGQRQMELELYRQLYGSQVLALGDAIKIAKSASSDIDVRTTWIYFGDPSIKIR